MTLVEMLVVVGVGCLMLMGMVIVFANSTRSFATVTGPRSLPFGTRISIEGLGERVVEDRQARRFDNQFDVFFPDHQSAKAFGKRKLQVRILN